MSRLRPAALVLLVTLLIGGALVLRAPPAPAPPADRPASARVVRWSADPAAPVEYSAAARAVEGECGLQLELACGEAFCAALTVMPDLDQLGGWLEISLRHPRFVLQTVARDLGVPASGLPCGSAVASLVGERGITAVELADGTELWCTVAGDGAAGHAWCRAEAADRLGVDVAFDRPGLRRLTFDRSGG